jgi:ribose transport system permease protein
MPNKQNMFKAKSLKNVGPLYVVVLGMAVLFFVIQPRFFSLTNMTNVGRQASVLAVLSCGQLFVVLVGCIDLSVGSLIGVTSVVTTLALLELGLLPGLALGLLTGVVLGGVNGVVVSYLRIPPMIATLAMLYFAKGAALTITGGMPVERLPKAFGILGKGSALGIPFPVIIAALTFAICYYVLSKVSTGRNIYAIGGGEETSRLAGIAVRRYKVFAYMVSGLMAALGSIILSSRMSMGQPILGEGLEFESIAAVVVGGARLGGGKGTIPGTILGVLFLAILGNGLNLSRVSSFTQMIVVGCVLIAAVVMDRWRS